MAKAKIGVAATDWENAEQSGEGGQWESLSGAFAPLWKPEQGNAIIVLPVAVHTFKVKKDAKVKTPSFAIECILKGGSTANFYSGKGSAASVNIGDSVTVGSSFNLVGEDKLVVIHSEKKGNASASLSKMSRLLAESTGAFRIVFNGQVKLDGGRKVNDYTVQVPNGYKEKFKSYKEKKD